MEVAAHRDEQLASGIDHSSVVIVDAEAAQLGIGVGVVVILEETEGIMHKDVAGVGIVFRDYTKSGARSGARRIHVLPLQGAQIERPGKSVAVSTIGSE